MVSIAVAETNIRHNTKTRTETLKIKYNTTVYEYKITTWYNI